VYMRDDCNCTCYGGRERGWAGDDPRRAAARQPALRTALRSRATVYYLYHNCTYIFDHDGLRLYISRHYGQVKNNEYIYRVARTESSEPESTWSPRLGRIAVYMYVKAHNKEGPLRSRRGVCSPDTHQAECTCTDNLN
jgi:hypothetical protein